MLLHGLPAVDDQCVSGDEGGRVRAKPQHGGGNLLRLAHSSDRLWRDHPVQPGGGALGEPLHHLPPPWLSISGISCFMHRNTPLRLMAIIRCHSSSVRSAVAVTGWSTPALFKAAATRPNPSTALSNAAFTSSLPGTSHLTA